METKMDTSKATARPLTYMSKLRIVRDWLYRRFRFYAPDVCVYCGVPTSMALPYDVNPHGWPCCANCDLPEVQQ